MSSILAHPIAELIAKLTAERRAHAFYRELAHAAVHQLHDQHVEIQRQRRQIARMAAELRELRQVHVAEGITANTLPDKAAA